MKLGQTIVAERERVESDSERMRARKTQRRKRGAAVVTGALMVVILGVLLWLVARQLLDQPQDLAEVAETYEIQAEIVDEDNTGRISERVRGYIGQLEQDLADLGYKVTRVTLPTGTSRELYVDLEGVEWFFKVTTDRDAAMTAEDMERQSANVRRMRLMGADVVAVESGSRTLKDAINAALRAWISLQGSTHYCFGTAAGPYPFPDLVREFQSVIGREARAQMLEKTGALPDAVVAAVGGGSNAIGMFSPFVPDASVRLFGVEAGGTGEAGCLHSAAVNLGRPGVLHGEYTMLLQDENGQILPSGSISAGLDYPGVGPEHAHLAATGRVEYGIAYDHEALGAFQKLCRMEGILPALESSHALAFVLEHRQRFAPGSRVLVNLSGRGDKDMDIVEKALGLQPGLELFQRQLGLPDAVGEHGVDVDLEGPVPLIEGGAAAHHHPHPLLGAEGQPLGVGAEHDRLDAAGAVPQREIAVAALGVADEVGHLAPQRDVEQQVVAVHQGLDVTVEGRYGDHFSHKPASLAARMATPMALSLAYWAGTNWTAGSRRCTHARMTSLLMTPPAQTTGSPGWSLRAARVILTTVSATHSRQYLQTQAGLLPSAR